MTVCSLMKCVRVCVRFYSRVCELNSVYQFSSLSCLIYGSSTWSTLLFSVYEYAISLFCKFFFTLLFAWLQQYTQMKFLPVWNKIALTNQHYTHTHAHDMVAYRTLTQISLWLFCVFLLNESDRLYSSSGESACVCVWRTPHVFVWRRVCWQLAKYKNQCAQK